MATIEEYVSDQFLAAAKEVLTVLKASDEPLTETPVGNMLLEKTIDFQPKLVSPDEAVSLVENSSHCAVGERYCFRNNPDAEFTETILLDDLAEAMVSAGKARMVSKEEAKSTLEKYKQHPKILSKVSGKHVELCNTTPETCIYWNMERCGLKIIQGK